MLDSSTNAEWLAYNQHRISALKNAIHDAPNEETLNTLLTDLSNLLTSLDKDEHLANVQHFLADLIGTVESVKMHDYTRANLEQMLDEFVNSMSEEIAHAEENKNVEKLRALFENLANHAEEISKFINIEEIYKK